MEWAQASWRSANITWLRRVALSQREGLASGQLAFEIWFQIGSNVGVQTGMQRAMASSLLLVLVGGYVVLHAAASVLGGIRNQ